MSIGFSVVSLCPCHRWILLLLINLLTSLTTFAKAHIIEQFFLPSLSTSIAIMGVLTNAPALDRLPTRESSPLVIGRCNVVFSDANSVEIHDGQEYIMPELIVIVQTEKKEVYLSRASSY